MSNRIVRGTILLTTAAMISKILGMIYIIPFNELVGAKGGALYTYAYSQYTILISISTVGVPLAVSKIVSRYNTLGYYNIGFKVFRMSFYLMLTTGILAFITLFLSAEWLATKIVFDDQHGNSVEDVKSVIQMVSFALIIIPAMSSVRGFFQGHQSMGPTAASEVIEQIVRIAFVLIAAFMIVSVFNGSYVTAVSYATFAAFIGGLASCLVLYIFWRRRKTGIEATLLKQEKSLDIPNKLLLLELFSYAGPFVLVGIATPLYQLIDTFTFNRAMTIAGYGEVAELSFAAINFLGHKLIIIPVTVATGLSLAIVPALTESFTKKNFTKLTYEINQAIQIVLILVIPAVFGLIALSNEAYGALFGMGNIKITGTLLAWYAPVALLFALYIVSSAILQGINEQRFALVSLSAGVILKLATNSFFIHTFGGKGAIFATGLAVLVAISINFWRIKIAIDFSYKQTFKRGLFMFVFSGIMFSVILLLKYLFAFILPFDQSRFAAVIMLVIGVSGGGLIYLFLTYKSTLLDYVLGNTHLLEKIRRKLRARR